MGVLIIADNQVGINKDGMYCLNDLHKAAMVNGTATESQRPSNFIKSADVQAFINALSDNASIVALSQSKGRNGGTWANEIVAMKYAGWIDPAYEVQVYQAVQALKRGDIEKAVTLSGSTEARRALDDMRHAKAVAMQLGNVEKFQALFPNIGERASQAFAAAVLNPVIGIEAVPLPKIEEKFYTTTELAEEFETTPAMLGRLANRDNLKTSEFGEFRLSQSKHSAKQVEQFYWNAAGRDALRDVLARARA